MPCVRRISAALLFSLVFTLASAQKHQQLWLDYQLDLPFANQYLFEMVTSYQTILTNTDRWRSFNVAPTFEYQGFRRLDILGGVPMAYTIQTATYNSFEANPYVGARYHVSQNRRIDARLIFKVEERFFYHTNERDWENSNRMRLKAEVWTAINGPNLYQDKLYYAILDYEEFFVTDEQVDERFANRRRARLGLGYRLNYRNRFELIYTLQSSRNEIEGKFISADNILQLRYKMFFNPSKPVTTP